MRRYLSRFRDALPLSLTSYFDRRRNRRPGRTPDGQPIATLRLQSLEDRTVPTGVALTDPLKAQLLSGINSLSSWIDTELDGVGDMGRQLPFVGGSIGEILDAG